MFCSADPFEQNSPHPVFFLVTDDGGGFESAVVALDHPIQR